MKILYTIGTKFGGTGIGRIAAKSLVETAKRHELHIAAQSFEGVLPEGASATRIRPPLRWPLAEKKQYRLKRAIAFDAEVSKMIDGSLDLFISWNGHCLQCLKRARELGITTMVVRASSHMLTQMEILNEEFGKYGISREVELAGMIDRCVEEYELADHVLVPSEFVRKSFRDRGFQQERLICVPFGVDSAKFRPAGHSDSVLRLLFVGRIGLRKGVYYLLEAWKKLALPGAELVLLGNIEPGFQKILKPYRALPGLVIPGFVKDPIEQFANSSAFVFPSLEEGSALVTYEAMSAALPVITTFNSGSLARDGVDGFVIPIRNPQAICEKVTQLYENRSLLEQMGRSARELIARYTWERHSSELARHLEKIEEARGGARH